ncbi:MAG: 6-phosphogluconolactonase, partial [Gemmatimonadota bacterium]
MKIALEILPSAALAAEAAARRFTLAATAAIAARGMFVVALSGGSTPRAMYERLVAGARASGLDWSRVQVLWGDERCVPPEHEASNYRMTREALLDHVPVSAANVHRIRGETDPAEAAAGYERIVREVLGTAMGPPSDALGRRLDLVLLGLGEDGHTASLFPGSAAAHDTVSWVRAAQAPDVPRWRVTLTPVVINAAAEVVFMVSGS